MTTFLSLQMASRILIVLSLVALFPLLNAMPSKATAQCGDQFQTDIISVEDAAAVTQAALFAMESLSFLSLQNAVIDSTHFPQIARDANVLGSFIALMEKHESFVAVAPFKRLDVEIRPITLFSRSEIIELETLFSDVSNQPPELERVRALVNTIGIARRVEDLGGKLAGLDTVKTYERMRRIQSWVISDGSRIIQEFPNRALDFLKVYNAATIWLLESFGLRKYLSAEFRMIIKSELVYFSEIVGKGDMVSIHTKLTTILMKMNQVKILIDYAEKAKAVKEQAIAD